MLSLCTIVSDSNFHHVIKIVTVRLLHILLIISIVYLLSSIQSLSHVRLCDPMDCSMPGFPITNSWSLLKLMSVKWVTLSNHLILCCPLLLLSSIFPASGSFPMSQFFASGGQSIGVSASTSVLPVNIQD